MSFADLTHPDDRAGDDGAAAAMLTGEIERYAPAETVRPKGRHLGLGTTARSRLLGSDGAVSGIAHVIDITAQRKDDQARRRHEALGAALSAVRLAMLRGASRQQGLDLICQSAVDCLQAGSALILTPSADGDDVVVEASANVSADALAGLLLSALTRRRWRSSPDRTDPAPRTKRPTLRPREPEGDRWPWRRLRRRGTDR